MRKFIPTAFIVAVSLFIFTGGTAFAQGQQIALPSAGLTPESPFYFLDRLGEGLRQFFTFNPEGRARLQITFAAERVAEIKVILETKGVEAKGLAVAQSRLQAQLANAAAIVTDLKSEGKDVGALANELRNMMETPKSILAQTFKKQKRALEAKEEELKTQLRTAHRAGDIAQKESLAQELGKIKAQKELLELKEENINDDIEVEEERIEEQMEAQSKAEKAIREAEKEEQEEKESRKIKTFHYQLQNVKYDNLKELDVDLMVVDIDDVGFTKSEIEKLKNNKKIILSYLSIGEAENYRKYWQSDWKIEKPNFLDEENPNWKGNFKVKYWYPEWQEIIIDAVSRIAENGYDGAYLDIIDAYEYYEARGRESANREMIDFIRKIKDKGKEINPNFLIVPQNSPELYALEKYKEIIDGLGKEDVWYDDDNRQNEEETKKVLKFLDAAIKDGKFILAIDYPTEKDKISDFYKKCQTHKFTCTASNRNLDLKKPLPHDD